MRIGRDVHPDVDVEDGGNILPERGVITLLVEEGLVRVLRLKGGGNENISLLISGLTSFICYHRWFSGRRDKILYQHEEEMRKLRTRDHGRQHASARACERGAVGYSRPLEEAFKVFMLGCWFEIELTLPCRRSS